MSSLAKPLLTPEQYLHRERTAESKSEYFRGEMFAMAGASRRHNRIVGNIVGEIRTALKDRRCEVYPSDMRVKISPSGLYTYPDASVACEEPKSEDEFADTLLNPTLLFDVLSKTTESYDRGVKFSHYRRLPEVKEVVLIAQERCSVECYRRQSDGTWLLVEATSLETSITLSSIEVTVSMAEIYRNVSFADESESAEHGG